MSRPSRSWRALAGLSSWGVVVSAAAYVIVYPLCVVDIPPFSDMPAHAASIATLRHYFDPSWHLREQFTFHPLESPYAFLYVLGAILNVALPIAWATKIVFMLAMATLPVGLGVLFAGMKKSPLWGVLGLSLVWSTPVQWGFVNHVAAVGFYVMSLGATLLALDRPTRGRQLFLALSLLLVFLSHVFRMPFALLSVAGLTAVMWPATRRVRPVVGPLALGVVCMLGWQLVRRPSMKSKLDIDYQGGRFAELWPNLFSGFNVPEEHALAKQMFTGLGYVFVVALALWWVRVARRRWSLDAWRWNALAAVGVSGLVAGALGSYLTLPMSIGLWWWVYPREITTTVLLAFALMPDLPRHLLLRLPMLAAVAMLVVRFARLDVQQNRRFDATVRSFRAILDAVPPAPKLMYLVFDHSGSTRFASPFVHLPMWVQAERGGWLSWHFAVWGLHPLRYREGPGAPPPRREERWEWRPDLFEVRRDGAFFDTFLVRSATDPGALFAADPSIRSIAQAGTWWLYRRGGEELRAAGLPADAPGAGVRIEDAVTTRGCVASPSRTVPGGEVGLRCEFEVTRALPESWSIYVHVEDPSGAMRVHADHVPGGGRAPTNTWPAGKVVVDSSAFVVPPDAPPGEYRVYFGFWRPDRQARVSPAAKLDPKLRILGPTLQIER